MHDWWEGNIHYYDYDPQKTRRWHDKVDTFVVAEAAIYSADNTPKIGLVFLVSGQDLKSGITMEAAIEKARQIRPAIVQEWRGRVEEIGENLIVLLDWKGQEIEKRQAKP